MSQESVQARAIFIDAVENVSPERWREYLDEACGDDAALRDKVQRLLDAHGAIGSFMDKPAAAPVATLDQPITEKPGTQIGPYKLLQQLGEGGMGVVYMAEQKEPVKRRVALKIIKPGMDTRQVIARFEAERQALAMMDHPNIAKVLDAGQTESGRPYFVMELVNGISVTQYCDEQHLTPKERLELFVPICQAVQHAHQKGIIHRDLKPSNILVALYDGQPVPKVIDFGVAKATNQTLTEKTMFTQLGQVVGTLEYMSPEQAQRNQLDIDTRSDIYSLGVVLYELLTGETPFDRARLRSAAFDEMLRIIREEEPSKPSTKVSSSLSLPSIAANRRIEPAKLGSMIRGELDWIVLKAMEKDRGRRYETASKFAEDVQNYLNDEAVVACPPSRAYRFRKFAKRNKAILATATTIVTALILGIAGTSWQAYRASRAEGVAARRLDVVETQKQELAEAMNRVDQQAEKAIAEAEIATSVVDFLNEDMLGLGEAGTQLTSGLQPDPNLKLRTVIDRAAIAVDEEFQDKPLVEAAIRKTLGVTYGGIGAYDESRMHLIEAVDIYRKRLGVEDEKTLACMYSLAVCYFKLDRISEARDLTHEVLRVRRRTLGDQHVDTLNTECHLAAMYFMEGRDAEAEEILQKAFESLAQTVGLEHRDTQSAMQNLASIYMRQYRFAEAADLLHKSLDAGRQSLGALHPRVLSGRFQLAAIYRDWGQIENARREIKQTLGLQQQSLGKGHPDVSKSASLLASIYGDLGRWDEAVEVLKETLEAQRDSLGSEHRETLRTMRRLSWILRSQGNNAESIKLSREVFNVRRRILGEDHPDTIRSMNTLAGNLTVAGNPSEAESLLGDAISILNKFRPNDTKLILTTRNNLGQVYMTQGKYKQAEEMHEKTLDILRKSAGEKHRQTAVSMANLAAVYSVQKRFRKAAELYQEAIGVLRISPGEENPDTSYFIGQLASVYGALGRFAEAEELFRKVLLTLERTQPNDFPLAKRIRAQFAELLANQAWPLVVSSGSDEGNREEALRLTREAVDMDPQSILGWQSLGWAQYRADLWVESLESLNQSCSLHGGQGDCGQWIVMALAHWKLATSDDTPESQRDIHLRESKRLYDQANRQMNALFAERPTNDPLKEAFWDFREEAASILNK